MGRALTSLFLFAGLIATTSPALARPDLGGALRRLLRRPPPAHQLLEGLSPEGRAIADRIRAETGYRLDDSGLRPNPNDRERWSDRDVKRIAGVLCALPARLRFLPRAEGGCVITHDQMNQEEQAQWARVESTLSDALQRARAEKAGFRRSSTLRVQLALVRGFRRLGLGTVFGNAYFDRPEIRLYDELLDGSRLPGLKRMLAFTTVHELGHIELEHDADLRRRWNELYFHGGGREELARWCGYAASSAHEGYGVGIGCFAVAPGLLGSKSKVHGFFADRFGKDAFKALRGGITERLAIQLVYRLGDIAAGLQ